MAQLNDAVLLPHPRKDSNHGNEYTYKRVMDDVSINSKICRVIAVTEGRAVIEFNNEVLIEIANKPWPVVGTFVYVKRWFRLPYWEFHPNNK
jgi:hypothetical protein